MKALIISVALLCATTSCGVKGKPLPPDQPAWIGRGDLSLSEKNRPSAPPTTLPQ